MMDSNIWTAVITAVTVLGSTQAFRYYERRAMHKERDEDFIRHDCKDRIAKLEALLEDAKDEKEEMRNLILKLTAEVAELRTKVEFLTTENAKLIKSHK
jgi:hypothetical protein